MLASEFALLVEKPRRSGAGYSCLAPCHEDRKSSFYFQDGELGLVVRCYAGCTVEDVCLSTGVNVSELFEDTQPQERTIEADYVYENEEGKPWIKVRRYRPKAFVQMHYENGDWIMGLNGQR